ncbi:hypothetical protein F5146DRAFT_1225080 [Armillaria mellea]|nr:hypothetical protein F5146DRAFT_1225080 [Armillaria mellea]
MLLYFTAFWFSLAASNGFKFGPITGDATVGSPFTLAWTFDNNDDPHKVHLEQRLQSQNSGDGKTIPFSFPNGTLNGTVPVIFAVPEVHLVEAFQDGHDSPVATSSQITVSSAESAPSTTSLTAFTTSSSSSSGDSAPPTSSSITSADYNSAPSNSLAGSSGTNPTTSAMTNGTTTSASGANSNPSQYNVFTALAVPGITKTTESTALQSHTSASPSYNSNTSKSSSTSGSLSRTLRIVGATVGGFVFLLLLLAALVYILRRRSLRRKRYPTLFHRDRMVRKRSNASFSPLTPTKKDPETYTNFADVKKLASYSSRYKEELAPSPPPQEGCLEYSLPAPLGPRAETPSPIPAHTDRQMEIYDVLVKKNTDLIRLKTELRRGGDVKEEIEELKATIGGLEEALASPWALGYTDEMPYEVSRAMVPN